MPDDAHGGTGSADTGATLPQRVADVPKRRWLRLTHEGVDYEVSRKAGNSPELRVAVAFDDPATGAGYRAQRETGLERLAKRLGLSVELATGDTEFDRSVYLITDTPALARELFAQADKRAAVRTLLKQGFGSVEHRAGRITAERSGAIPKKLERGVLEKLPEAAQALAELARGVPALPAAPGERSRARLARVLAYSVATIPPIAVLALPIALALLGLRVVNPLDSFWLFVYSLQVSVPAVVLHTLVCAVVARGRSWSHVPVVLGLLVSLLLVPAGAWLGAAALNSGLDRGPASVHHARVLEKHTRSSRSGRRYYLEVESWRKRGGRESIRVKRRAHREAAVGRHVLAVTTRPGHLGFEWVERSRLGEASPRDQSPTQP